MGNSPLQPLRHAEVRRLWLASTVSDIGTWVQLVVVGSLIARDTGSAFLTGLTALATFMPQGLASPIGGLLADRFDRAKVFALGLAGQALFTGTLAVLLGLGRREPLLLTAIILCSSACGSLGAPGYAAMIPDLVAPDELLKMISLGIFAWNAGRIIGPLLGAAIDAAVGPAWTVAFNAMTFALLATAVLSLRRPFLPPAPDTLGIRTRLAQGFSALRAVRGCRAGTVAIVWLNLAVGPFIGLIPIYARSVFDKGLGLAGLLSSVQGLGAIGGSVAVSTLVGRRGFSGFNRRAVVVLMTAYVVFAVAPSPGVALVAVCLLGAGTASIFGSGMGVVQRDAPPAMRGRVLSLAQAGMGTSYGIGLLCVGGLADLTSMRTAFLAAAGFGAVLIFVLMRAAPWWGDAYDGRLPPTDAEVADDGVNAPS